VVVLFHGHLLGTCQGERFCCCECLRKPDTGLCSYSDRVEGEGCIVHGVLRLTQDSGPTTVSQRTVNANEPQQPCAHGSTDEHAWRVSCSNDGRRYEWWRAWGSRRCR
jgi:hypothetical protein